MGVTHLHRPAVPHGSKSHRYSMKPIMDHYHRWYHRLSWKCDVQKYCIIPSLEPCNNVTIIWTMIPSLPEDGNHGCNGTWKNFLVLLVLQYVPILMVGEKMMATMQIIWKWWKIEPKSWHPWSPNRNRPSIYRGLNRRTSSWWRWRWYD